MKNLPTAALAVAALAVPALAIGGPASADHIQQGPGKSGDTYTASLDPVPNNHVDDASGDVTIALRGQSRVATVTITTQGLLDSVHAQHIHVGALGQCPDASDSTEHNGQLSTSVLDAADKYGAIGTSLTTKGDTSPSSGLAIDRFPVQEGGAYTYERNVKLSQDTYDAITSGESGVVVVHGIDYNGNGEYDFDSLGASELDSSLPMEATAPALCGALN